MNVPERPAILAIHEMVLKPAGGLGGCVKVCHEPEIPRSTYFR